MNLVENQYKVIELLLVEDNYSDYILTKECFELQKLALNLHHVVNGEECMQFLLKQDKYATSPTPDIILLDINLPVMDGREVLAEIIKHEKLKCIPVVVLTTSQADKDILDMYKLRCSSYLTKPVDFNNFREVITQLSSYWFTVVAMPHTDNE
ncbi:response regulator [Spartinivicinus poritis]|uniref:Response regulator n=1 Tax=Spartinivicinus poritis TaxID=2994640 RepID=A0ABT5UJU4_9GAMM|nr:response regulator [Spartinivicinus sp. A2-2]MDE1465673.1 response regulator [Spartinivicinus sp. A2-2]